VGFSQGRPPDLIAAPTIKTLGKGKGRNVVCDIAALNKTSKNNQASARTSRPQ
jgi:hypothetical protein